MKTKKLSPCSSVALIRSWACRGAASVRSRARRGVASSRSRILPALVAVLNLLPAGRVTAETLTVLHSFTYGSDGAYPTAGLITNSSGNTLYGTAVQGGSPGYGTVFAVNTDGTGFTNLHNFAYYDSDGAYPKAGLILSVNSLYGTGGGSSPGNGTVFAVNTDRHCELSDAGRQRRLRDR
jgi:uncharacterized repeat protein (TIGR03803 family)